MSYAIVMEAGQVSTMLAGGPQAGDVYYDQGQGAYDGGDDGSGDTGSAAPHAFYVPINAFPMSGCVVCARPFPPLHRIFFSLARVSVWAHQCALRASRVHAAASTSRWRKCTGRARTSLSWPLAQRRPKTQRCGEARDEL